MQTLQLTKSQTSAIEQILDWAAGDEPAISLTGPAGTGKSTLLDQILAKLGGQSLVCAMTGKAALRLRDFGISARTFHSAFFQPPDDDSPDYEFTKINGAPGGIVVIDEASMLTPDLYDKLDEAWLSHGTRVILVGDSFQLPPVINSKEAALYGSDFSVFRKVAGPQLTEVMRAGDDILWAATALRAEGRLPQQSRGAYQIRHVPQAITAAVETYLAHPDDHALVTWRNAMRIEASKQIREKIGCHGAMPEVGEPILICKNGQTFLNGEIIEAGEFRPGPRLGPVETMFMRLAEPVSYVDRSGNEREVVELLTHANMDGRAAYIEDRDDWKAYVQAKRKARLPEPTPITWGYALTCHKVQGSEYDHVTTFLTNSDVFAKPFKAPTALPDHREVPFSVRFLYTALTRAKKQATIIIGAAA